MGIETGRDGSAAMYVHGSTVPVLRDGAREVSPQPASSALKIYDPQSQSQETESRHQDPIGPRLHPNEALSFLIEEYDLFEPSTRTYLLKKLRDPLSRENGHAPELATHDEIRLYRAVLEQSEQELFQKTRELVENLLVGEDTLVQEELRGLLHPAISNPASKLSALMEVWFTKCQKFDERDLDLLFKLAGMRKGQELLGNLPLDSEPGFYKIPLRKGPEVDVYSMSGISQGAEAIAWLLVHSRVGPAKEKQELPLYGKEALNIAFAIEKACRILGVKGAMIEKTFTGSPASWQIRYSHLEALPPYARFE